MREECEHRRYAVRDLAVLEADRAPGQRIVTRRPDRMKRTAPAHKSVHNHKQEAGSLFENRPLAPGSGGRI